MRPLVRCIFYHFLSTLRPPGSTCQHFSFVLNWLTSGSRRLERADKLPQAACYLAEAFFHGAFYFAVCGFFGDLAPFVVLPLAADHGDLEFDDAVLGVEFEGDEGLALLLALADEAVDLFAVQKQLAVARGELTFLPGVRVGGDVGPDQEHLPVPHPGVALFQVGATFPNGLHFWSRQLDAGLVGLLDRKVVKGLSVAREVCHSRFTILSSARCMSGSTSSNSTRTLSPTL